MLLDARNPFCKDWLKDTGTDLYAVSPEGELMAQLGNNPRLVGTWTVQLLLAVTLTLPVSLPALAGTTTYSYDVQGRLIGVVTPNGATQTIVVFAFDNAGNRTKIQMSCQDVLAPNAPTGLTATVMASNRIRLNWSAITDACGRAVAAYKVYRGNSNVASVGATTYDDKNLAPNTPYTYAVTAVDTANLESAKSATSSANTPPGADTTPPSVPSGLQGVAISGTWINLAWGASQDNSGGSGLAGYDIFRNGAQIGSSTVASYADSSLISGSTYSYQVRAFDVTGNKSALSNAVTVVTPDTVSPSAPGVPVISAITGTSAVASWSPATDNLGVTGYRYSLNAKASWTVSSSSPATLGGLSPYTRYTVVVQARDAAGNWGPDASIDFTTLDTVPPGAPGSITISGITANAFTANWLPASDNVGVVNYRYSVNGGTSWVSSGGARTATVSGLALNTNYTLLVQASDAAGNWGPSASASVKTAAYYTEVFAYTGGSLSVNNGLGIRTGFLSGGFGSLSPSTTVNGRSIGSYYSSMDYYFDGMDFSVMNVSTFLTVGGFSANPGAAWLQSVGGAGGSVLTGASATFSCSGSGPLVCVWSWPQYSDMSGSVTMTLVHQ